MLTNYIERKNEVLSEYEQFEKRIKSLESTIVEIGLESPINLFKDSLDDARRKADNIRADRFRLMIAGESKSGKSTFINAYLGIELLPMDVKQCTSSIVEIKYGTSFRLLATYADGKKHEYKDESAIRAFLKANASLDDNYRDIPVPTINHDLLIRYGQKSKGGNVNIPKSEIDAFLSNPQIKSANIHNIRNYNNKIQSYIESRKNDWCSIVVKIELFFPFEDEALKGIEIVDSPGVCARGGVAEITAKYIENADAIIFLKPISGQALESSQFTEFMRNASVERNKSALFLVLTRTTNVTPADLKRLEGEAYKQFSQLDKRNILFVDSKAELYVRQFEMCSSLEEIQEILIELSRNENEDDDKKDNFLLAALEKSRKDMFSPPDKDLFVKRLREMSNFIKINEALSVFGRKAHFIAFASLLEIIMKVYTRIIGDLDNHIARFKEKADDPNELTKKIGEIKLELEAIQNKMYRGVDEIGDRYRGEEGHIKKKADTAAEDFKKKVAKISKTDNYCFDELERQAIHKIDEFKNLQESIQKAIVQECNAALIEISNESEIPYTSLEPDFSEDTFENIKKSTKSKANETYRVETGASFFKSYETRSRYSRDKHFTIVKDSILSRLETIKSDLIANLSDFVTQLGGQYLTKLKQNADYKKVELDAIKEAKLNAEQIQEIINNLSELSANCNDSKRNAEKIKGGINKYVQ